MEKDQNRQARKTREALLSAFKALLDEKGYKSITVAEIADRADVGRSSFYRHFEDKRGMLMAMHSAAYEHWGVAPSTPKAWLSDTPSVQLVGLFERMNGYRGSVTFFNEMGAEITQLVRQLEKTLADQVKHGLETAFSGHESQIPMSLLASQFADLINGTLKWHFESDQSSAEMTAAYLQKSMRALVCEAFDIPVSSLE